MLNKALCKYRGLLVVAEVSVRTDGTNGSCPDCGNKEFHEHAGWAECDCGFAYLMADLDRIKNETALARPDAKEHARE